MIGDPRVRRGPDVEAVEFAGCERSLGPDPGTEEVRLDVRFARSRHASLHEWQQSPTFGDDELEFDSRHDADRIDPVRQARLDHVGRVEVEETQRDGQPQAQSGLVLARLDGGPAEGQAVHLQRAAIEVVHARAELVREGVVGEPQVRAGRGVGAVSRWRGGNCQGEGCRQASSESAAG